METNLFVSESSYSLSEQQFLLDSSIEEFQKKMLYYRAALDIMNAKLRVLTEEFKTAQDRSPIEHIQSRLKSPQSIMRKIHIKNLSMDSAVIEKNILDIAGIRIICPFLNDVYQVADMILRQPDIRLLRSKDYIASPKENGYRSLHLIVMVDVQFSNEKKSIPVEIQLRTIAMNCWAAVEHQLRYKKEYQPSEEVGQILQNCAQLMCRMDEESQRMANSVFQAIGHQ